MPPRARAQFKVIHPGHPQDCTKPLQNLCAADLTAQQAGHSISAECALAGTFTAGDIQLIKSAFQASLLAVELDGTIQVMARLKSCMIPNWISFDSARSDAPQACVTQQLCNRHASPQCCVNQQLAANRISILPFKHVVCPALCPGMLICARAHC